MPKSGNDASNIAFAERLIALLEGRGHPRRGAGAYLARKYSVATVTANAWLNGEHRMAIDLARKIASDHGASFDELYFGTNASAPGSEGAGIDANVSAAAPPRGRIPVISEVQAGHFTEVVDNYHPGDADEWLEVSCPVNRHTFALIVTGDSMEPEFPSGVRVVVEPDLQWENGDYVVAGNGEGATLKQIVRDGNDWYLKPLNPRYPIKPLGKGRVIGVVHEAHRKYR